LSDLLVVAAAAFFLLHVLPSTPVRARSVALAGEGVYLAVFSLLSLVTIWWLTKQFNAAPCGTKLWFAPSWWPWLQAALILFALILSVGGLTTPNPSSPGAGKLLESPHAAGGIFAITRHPVYVGCRNLGIGAHGFSCYAPRPLVFWRIRSDCARRDLASTEAKARDTSGLDRV
jgi:uncharacterized membrane protein